MKILKFYILFSIFGLFLFISKSFALEIVYWTTEFIWSISWDNETINNNFNWKTITVWDYTIMDRNLWASESWDWISRITSYISWYGYLYQWWNNYGFWFEYTPETEWNQVSVDLDLIPSKYISNIFIRKEPWNKNATEQDNLRWFLWNTWDRQWPCPSGWHVPTSWEWLGIYNAWNSASNKSIVEPTTTRNFVKDILLPPAWYRKYDDLSYSEFWVGANYWSSTPSWKNSAYAFVFKSNSNSVVWKWRSNGRSLRCFKDENLIVRTVSFDSFWWNSIKTIWVLNWEYATRPDNPTRPDSQFLWRYLTWSNTPFDFNNQKINSDITLYAKYSCNNWYNETEDKHFCVNDSEKYEIINITWTDWAIIQTNYQKWEDLTLNFWDLDFTIMDRNLWAFKPSEWDIYSDWVNVSILWYYYQWWNNYWFPWTWNIVTKGARVDASIYWTWKYFADSVYINRWNWTSWDNPINQNLRGGESNIDEYMQWPCPFWYHVPRELEWVATYNIWCRYNNEDCFNKNGESYWIMMKLPLAWARAYNNWNNFFDRWTAWYYRSSNKNSNATASMVSVLWLNPKSGFFKTRGTPLRCFKNSEYQLLTIVSDNEKNNIIHNFYRYEPISLDYKPENPTKSWFYFSWWYKWDEEFIFSDSTYISKPTTITAKRKCNSWYSLNIKWTECVKKINYEFVNYDWTILQSWTVLSWEVPSYINDIPVKPSDGSYNYTFSWRSPTIKTITTWIIYTAQFIPTPIAKSNNYSWWWGRKSSSTRDKFPDIYDSLQSWVNSSAEQTTTSSQNDNKSSSWTDVKDLKWDTKDSSDKSSEWQNQQQFIQEFQEAHEFAKEKWITTMPTINEANMNWKLTRIAMAKMLSYYAINVLWQKPDETRINKFNDITEKLDSQYDSGVTLAYQLWIMWINMPNNNFRPNDEVTRAEFATALSRMLYSTPDGKPYYTTHLQKLKAEWILTNDDYKMKELRGYVMIMLKRSAK